MPAALEPRKSLLAAARASMRSAAKALREPAPVEIIDGRYRVVRQLGRGGMGTVYLAEDLRLAREVAVKVLSPDLAKTETMRRRFLEEARAMGGLRHDHVAQVYSYGTHADEPYIVMEYVQGETADAFASRWPKLPDLDTTLALIDQLARGLSAIHAAGIIHGDIKPSNVLLGPHFRVVVVDFGLMRWLGDAEDLSIVVGTPAYIPPEVVTADSIELRLTPAADVFALGVTAYELLTRCLPFRVTNVDELFEVHLANKKAPPISKLRPELPRAFDEVFGRVLSGSLSERYRSADEFRRALLAARRDPSITSTPQSLVIALPDEELRHALKRAMERAVLGLHVRATNEWTRVERELEHDSSTILIIDESLIPRNILELDAHAPDRSSARGPNRRWLVVGAQASPAKHRAARERGSLAHLCLPVDPATIIGIVRAMVAQ